MHERNKYLQDTYVQGFITYLSGVLTGDTPLNFTVGFPRSRLPINYESCHEGKVEQQGTGSVFVVTVHTIKQLFDHYWWDYKYYDANRDEVDKVRIFVRSAIAAEESATGVELTQLACKKVMDWGFGRGTRANESNISWAMGLGHSLVKVLQNGRMALATGTPDLSIFGQNPDESTQWSKMNSGWTKYYSFALPNHVIYDSRVGAALGYLVVNYLESLALRVRPHLIPPSLAFRWASGQGEGNVRNPSYGPYKFGRLYGGPTGSREWARANVQANWILTAAIEKSGAEWCTGQEGFRRLEGALFMLGYDLSRVHRQPDSAGRMTGAAKPSLFD